MFDDEKIHKLSERLYGGDDHLENVPHEHEEEHNDDTIM